MPCFLQPVVGSSSTSVSRDDDKPGDNEEDDCTDNYAKAAPSSVLKDSA